MQDERVSYFERALKNAYLGTVIEANGANYAVLCTPKETKELIENNKGYFNLVEADKKHYEDKGYVYIGNRDNCIYLEANA
jgi:hypothetical protein